MTTRSNTIYLFAMLLLASLLTSNQAAEPLSFNRDIRPILSDKCFACHGFDSKKREAELRLDVAEGATAEHEGKRAITPGELAKSEMWKRITSGDENEQMPPKASNKKLTAAEIATLKLWIEQGAPYQKHWAFEPPVKTTAEPGASNVIDGLLSKRQKKEGLAFNPEASKETLIRRVAFTLTGLPPTIAETDEYLNDKSPEAYRKMVDHYLQSPRYGEEMAKHWLDVARYADTHGLHLDNERQMWAYRDYVVRAFNENKPFDQFTREQLAGDLLPPAANEQATQQQLIATGFSRCNVTTSEGGSINEEFIYRYAVDRASTTMQTWLGLSGGCAVCHDHKFDPISAREFYSFYAFFNSAADPAMDGNALLTQPTIKLSLPEQEKQRVEFEAQIAAKQTLLNEQIAQIKYTDPATLEPRPPVEEKETVWLEDDFPANAKVEGGYSDITKWINAEEGKVFSGKRALKRTENALGQNYYANGAEPLKIPAQAELFVHVWLDPQNPPKAIMIQFHKKEWKHRAVWGEYEAIPFGSVNTTERVNMGPLPAANEWVKLTVPAEKIGLQAGDSLEGFAVTQFGGTVYWDKLGVTGRIDLAADPKHSLLAWRTQAKGKDTPGAPPEINKLLKEGVEKPLSEDNAKKLREYYLQNVYADALEQFKGLNSELSELRRKRDDLDKAIPATFIYKDLPQPRASFVMMRGQYDKPGEKVEPGTLAILPPLKKANSEGFANRLDLANWLVAPENPLTARVTVNRLWQQVFGIGLVKSSGDFGSQGEPPVHPELLDTLAITFREKNWDVKELLRTLLDTQAFRQSARVTPELFTRDPENRLLARGPRMRLDAEQIRDNSLFVSGLMNFTMGGKGVNPYQPSNIWEPVGFGGSNTRFYKQDTGPAIYRRSLYTFLKRTAPPPFMVNFDGPNREQSCSRRERSNTPLQALQLMNDVQHFEAARVLAERILLTGGASPEERIQFAYRTILARRPSAEELAIVLAELNMHRAEFAKDEEAAKKAISHGESKPNASLAPSELAAYTLVANMLLNLDETLNRN